jgi:N-acyl-D-amino-acid deacylase
MHDLVIESARVYDGTGAPPIEGAVAVTGGKIAAVGKDLGPGKVVVDAAGLSLAPGIIDAHTHYDAQLTWDPYAIPSTLLGVSTVVIGNCGFTIAPCHPEDRDLTMRHLENVEAMPLDALRAGTLWDFETFAEYLDMLESGGTVPNVAAYCGHSALRTWVMRGDATKRAATDAEVAEMKAVLRGALDAGAIGLSTSMFEGHNGAGGVPMPSRLADEREFRALAATLGEAGKGIFITSQGAKDVAFAESLAAETGRPILLTGIVHNPATPESCFAEMAAVNAAQARGHPVYAQVACNPITLIFTLTSPYPFEALKAWQPAFAVYKYPGALAGLYRDPNFRQAVREELAAPGGATLFTGQWDRLVIVEAAKPENKRLEDCNVAELAAAEGADPLDWFLDFGVAEEFATRFYAEMLNYEDDQVERLLLDPAGHPSLSDGGAHLQMLCDAGFGLHMLGHWARERGAFTVEEAVRKVTSVPADIYGIKDRGRIAPGKHADLFLFDPDTVARGPKYVVYDLPAGAARITTDGIGVHGVWVNGQRIVDADGIIKAEHRPGTLLREFAV